MRIAVVGGGGHGQVIMDIVEKLPHLQLVGVLDAKLSIGSEVMGYPVLGRDDSLGTLVQEHHIEGAVIGIGDNWIRSKVAAQIHSAVPTIQFPNTIHPSATIGKGVLLGRGNVVMAGAVVNPNAVVGDFCILNTQCALDHDCRMGDFASFAPQACAGGNVTVGDFTAVGLGANIVHQKKLGRHCVIGAGSTVLHDITDNTVAYGTPARGIRQREAGERYL